MEVQRFILKAHPSKEHKKYYSWQGATLVVLVGEDDKALAEHKALVEIKRRNWIPDEFIRKDTLIEHLVREQGGSLWPAYCEAKKGSIYWVEDVDDIPFSTKDNPISMSAPRLSETFVDKFVENAGGHRATAAESADFKEKNADYIFNDYVIELKDLQEEGLSVVSRQQKIAELYSKYACNDSLVKLDPSILSEIDYKEYLEIIGRPIRKRMLSASKQLKATINRLGEGKYKGIVILLNTGYLSVPHEILETLSRRYARNGSGTIHAVITITSATLTNGFDTRVNFAFSSSKPEDDEIIKLRDSFWNSINELMTIWARNGFSGDEDVQTPMQPISFEKDGSIYTLASPKIKSTVPKPNKANQQTL